MSSKPKIPGKLYYPQELQKHKGYEYLYVMLREEESTISWKHSRILIVKFLDLFPNPVLCLGTEEFVETKSELHYQVYVRKEDMPEPDPKTWKIYKFWDGEKTFYVQPWYHWMFDEVA